MDVNFLFLKVKTIIAFREILSISSLNGTGYCRRIEREIMMKLKKLLQFQ